MKKFLLASTILMFAYSAQACPVTDKMGEPITNSNQNLYSLCRIDYHNMYNGTTKTPLWVAEDLIPSNVSGAEDPGIKDSSGKRKNPFKEDKDIPENVRSTLDDYENNTESRKPFRGDGNQLARGHMSAAENHNRLAAYIQSFLLSQMVPQHQNCNNAGIWSTFERMSREWTVHYGEIFVVSGPIYENGYSDTIGNGVAVPSHLFKVVFNPTLNQSIGFIVENGPLCKVKPAQVVASQATIEQVTGLQFFPKMSGYDKNNTKIWE